MKKATSYILLFLLFFTLIAYLPAVKLIQYNIRKEIKHHIKQSLDESELSLIRINKNTPLDWKKKDKEFRFKGKMYDIVKKRIENDDILYYCIYDEQESKLFEHLDQYVAYFLGEHPKQEKNIYHFLQKLELIYTTPFQQQITSDLPFFLWTFKKITHLYQFNFVELNTPPPKL